MTLNLLKSQLDILASAAQPVSYKSGKPSQAVGALTLDRSGLILSSLQLTGDCWRGQHDAILSRTTRDSKEIGLAVRPNGYGLFSACIPQEGRRRFDGQPMRKRQGLVPDLMITLQWDGHGPERRLLFEMKMMHFGTST